MFHCLPNVIEKRRKSTEWKVVKLFSVFFGTIPLYTSLAFENIEIQIKLRIVLPNKKRTHSLTVSDFH